MEITDRQTFKDGGAEGSRTPDLLIANETLYQLSYDPMPVLIISFRIASRQAIFFPSGFLRQTAGQRYPSRKVQNEFIRFHPRSCREKRARRKIAGAEMELGAQLSAGFESRGISRTKVAPLPAPSLWAVNWPPISLAALAPLCNPNPCPVLRVVNP